jgi:histidinol dehydrogenase
MLKVERLDEIEVAGLCDRAQSVDKTLQKRVQEIIADVAENGDAGLSRWTKELDGCDLESPMLPSDEWEKLASQCPPDVQQAIHNNLNRIIAFHELQVGTEQTLEVAPGVKLGRRPVAHQVAACYVPGGRAAYPSTVLMTVPLAKLAGVERILVVTPPQNDGAIDPAVAYAAKMAGATGILRAGGAQAIAALAHGTALVPRADCIVGPGNAYVTAAKQILSNRIAIDSPAGPSELLIIADDSANARFVAADMIAQAEHDPDARCLLVTDSVALAEHVVDQLEIQGAVAIRRAVVNESLRSHGRILVADSLADAVQFTNDFAPEHLEIMCEDSAAIAFKIRHAGSIFIGSHAPVSLGDYGSGTNHVLPTMGYAHFRGGLCVDDFRKWITTQEISEDGLAGLASDITTLAQAEGLHGHADAVRIRLEEN